MTSNLKTYLDSLASAASQMALHWTLWRGDGEEIWLRPPRTVSLLPFPLPCSGLHHEHCMLVLPRSLASSKFGH